MNYYREISVKHSISADPFYCSMMDGKQRRHCKYELRSACNLFKKALADDNFTNKKCPECLRACEAAALEERRRKR